MNNSFVIKRKYFDWIARGARRFTVQEWIIIISSALAIFATLYSFVNGTITSYGDAESHLNIAKRVIHSLTPGFAQLGGIWLPLPHLFLVPFVYFDWLWRTGLAGSIVSGAAFVISSLYIYRLSHLLTKSVGASFFAALVFMLNPNILYLQSTPMTELPLIVFFLLSTYYFVRYLLDESKKENSGIPMLILAAFFGFCASLSRYDGWALVFMEAGILFLYHMTPRIRRIWVGPREKGLLSRVPEPKTGSALDIFEGRVILFSALAFFGIALWLLWGFLILGDPLYFTHSQFSANSQQQSWLGRGELPAYHNLPVAFLYYFVTSMTSGGVLVSLAALAGMAIFSGRYAFYIFLILMVPFFFNVLTLFLGQSVIFIPSITPWTFEWTLFNVRYGVMMVPAFAIFSGYLFYRSKIFGRTTMSILLGLQCLLFSIGFSPVLAYEDGTRGLSSATAKIPDAQLWFAREYDYGLVLTDDFARTISIIRTPILMQDIIYIGNKPYWEESLVEPQKYARWIVMQKNDTVWQNLNDRPEVNARLFKYFNKVYTSEEVLIFRRIEEVQ